MSTVRDLQGGAQAFSTRLACGVSQMRREWSRTLAKIGERLKSMSRCLIPAPWRLIVTIMIIAGFGTSPGLAVELRSDAGANAATDIVTTRDQVEVALRLDNDSVQPVEITLNVRPVRVS